MKCVYYRKFRLITFNVYADGSGDILTFDGESLYHCTTDNPFETAGQLYSEYSRILSSEWEALSKIEHGLRI